MTHACAPALNEHDHECASAHDDLDRIADALFHPMGSDGVYARTALYEDTIERLNGFITRHREEGTEVLRFPPVMSRAQLEKSGYLKSFPNLLGCVCALHGSEADIQRAAGKLGTAEDWTQSLTAADLVLTPAACYPVYPLVAKRGPLPKGGLRFDVASDCFRHEPSKSLDRLQSFRMREYVCIGGEDDIIAFRERWMDRAAGFADSLGLPYQIDVASDPFFGRMGQMMAVSQLQQALKFELLIPFRPHMPPTACMSFNYHRDHFGTTWGIQTVEGGVAHTGCVAFGMDRLAVALFCVHGLEIERWPISVRAALSM